MSNRILDTQSQLLCCISVLYIKSSIFLLAEHCALFGEMGGRLPEGNISDGVPTEGSLAYRPERNGITSGSITEVNVQVKGPRMEGI